MIKKGFFLFFLLLLFAMQSAFAADDLPAEELNIKGVENIVSFTISPDGLTLLLTDKPKKENLLVKMCKRPHVQSEWSVAMEVPSLNELIQEEIVIEGFCYSQDARFLYFSANLPDSKGGMDLYRCTVNGDEYGKPVNMGSSLNSAENEGFPSVSGNCRTIFFTRSVDMKKLDKFKTNALWCASFNDETNDWNVPELVNVAINSSGISCPKMYEDNRTIFYSKIDDDNGKWQLSWVKRSNGIHWFLPVLMDTLNTKDSEMYPFFCKADQYLYFIVNSNDDSHPKCKLFRSSVLDPIRYPDKTFWIRGKISNKLDQKPVAANVEIYDPVLAEVKYKTMSDPETGEWHALLNEKETYMVHLFQKGYSVDYHLFDAGQTLNDIRHDVQLLDKVKLQVNTFDQEELTPLDAKIELSASQASFDSRSEVLRTGQTVLELPIGDQYLIHSSMPDYEDSSLQLDLSGEVMFDYFVRDVELKPFRRNLTIMITDEETAEPLSASILVVSARNRKKLTPETDSQNVGQYHISLREGESFDVEVRGPQGYAFNHVSIDLNSDRNLSQLNIALAPLKKKVAIQLNNINFELNSADLMESSFVELDRLIQLMIDNPDILVEIMAHTDDLGTDDYNDKLSNKRAKSVVDYLVINGIDKARLQSKGYGERVPLTPNADDESRARNRRVEMKIIDQEDLGL